METLDDPIFSIHLENKLDKYFLYHVRTRKQFSNRFFTQNKFFAARAVKFYVEQIGWIGLSLLEFAHALQCQIATSIVTQYFGMLLQIALQFLRVNIVLCHSASCVKNNFLRNFYCHIGESIFAHDHGSINTSHLNAFIALPLHDTGPSKCFILVNSHAGIIFCTSDTTMNDHLLALW